MFEAYKYANVWNVQERVIALHTFMHSVLFRSVCEAKSYEEEKKKKIRLKTEWESSFRLTSNKLSFLSSHTENKKDDEEEKKEKNYYANVDMQICE